MRLHLGFLPLTCLLLTACGGGSSPQPASTVPPAPADPIYGVYVGGYSDSLYGTGNLTMVMSENGQAVTGNFTATGGLSYIGLQEPSIANENTSTIAGTFDGTTFTAILRPGIPAANICYLSVTAYPDNSNTTFNGSYTVTNCNKVETGTLEVTLSGP